MKGTHEVLEEILYGVSMIMRSRCVGSLSLCARLGSVGR